MSRFAFLARPGWLGAMAAALAFTAACWLILAPWQFGRNTETAATIRAVDAAKVAAPVPVGQYLSLDRQPDESVAFRQVTATGVFDAARVFYVRLRQDAQGNPASEVVVPLRLDDGSLLLVDRGYRSIGDIASGPLPPLPVGRVTVTGRVQQDQTDPRNRPATLVDGRTEVQAVNAQALAGAGGIVLQGYIQLVAGSPGVLAEIGMPTTDPGPYLSYALQWCAFGAMSLLAMGYFVFREATDPRAPDDRTVGDPQRDPQPAGASAGSARRAGRDGFDRSQLYD